MHRGRERGGREREAEERVRVGGGSSLDGQCPVLLHRKWFTMGQAKLCILGLTIYFYNSWLCELLVSPGCVTNHLLLCQMAKEVDGGWTVVMWVVRGGWNENDKAVLYKTFQVSRTCRVQLLMPWRFCARARATFPPSPLPRCLTSSSSHFCHDQPRPLANLSCSVYCPVRTLSKSVALNSSCEGWKAEALFLGGE